MLKSLKRIGIVAALSTSAVATTADARDRYRHHDDDAAIAIGAGIVGLAIGAAIASDHDDRYYYRDRRYYRAYPDHYYYERAPRGYYRDYRRNRWYDRDSRYRGHKYYRKHKRWHDRHDRWRD